VTASYPSFKFNKRLLKALKANNVENLKNDSIEAGNRTSEKV
jgi:hypothetical protein